MKNKPKDSPSKPEKTKQLTDLIYRASQMLCPHSELNKISEIINKGINVNRADRLGSTPLMLAVLYNYLDLIHLLVERGANRYAKNINNMTAFDIAIYHKNDEAIKLLR